MTSRLRTACKEALLSSRNDSRVGHGLMRFIASRVLGGNDGVDEAIQNCRITVSRKTPRLEHESVFRSWLLRLLIDEALSILHRDQPVAELAGL